MNAQASPVPVASSLEGSLDVNPSATLQTQKTPSVSAPAETPPAKPADSVESKTSSQSLPPQSKEALNAPEAYVNTKAILTQMKQELQQLQDARKKGELEDPRDEAQLTEDVDRKGKLIERALAELEEGNTESAKKLVQANFQQTIISADSFRKLTSKGDQRAETAEDLEVRTEAQTEIVKIQDGYDSNLQNLRATLQELGMSENEIKTLEQDINQKDHQARLKLLIQSYRDSGEKHLAALAEEVGIRKETLSPSTKTTQHQASQLSEQVDQLEKMACELEEQVGKPLTPKEKAIRIAKAFPIIVGIALLLLLMESEKATA